MRVLRVLRVLGLVHLTKRPFWREKKAGDLNQSCKRLITLKNSITYITLITLIPRGRGIKYKHPQERLKLKQEIIK